MNKDIASIRKEYQLTSLNENDAEKNPFLQFSNWWNDAVNNKITEVNAMTLATASADGTPHARIVLLKSFDEKGFTFFTNYNSSKGLQLAENNKAALVFFWKELERQVRIEGVVEKTSEEESDEYFNSRPKGSKAGAWASPQSKLIADRKELEENFSKYYEQFKADIPRPEFWGGYLLKPASIEFWQGGNNRLHDRLLYSKKDTGWKIERLAP